MTEAIEQQIKPNGYERGKAERRQLILRTAAEMIAEAAREQWVGLFYHDTHVPFARVSGDGKRYAIEPVAALA